MVVSHRYVSLQEGMLFSEKSLIFFPANGIAEARRADCAMRRGQKCGGPQLVQCAGGVKEMETVWIQCFI